MPFKKVNDNWSKVSKLGVEACKHPEHNPPGMIYLEPGTYEYTCPGCGNEQVVVKPKVML